MKTPTLTMYAICLILISSAIFAQDKTQPFQLAIHVRDYCDPATFNAALGAAQNARLPEPAHPPLGSPPIIQINDVLAYQVRVIRHQPELGW